MELRWLVARVNNNIVKTFGANAGHALVRFKLIEPLIFKEKKVRWIVTSFSSKPEAQFHIAEFLEAIEYPLEKFLEFPNQDLNKRYCRLAIQSEICDKDEYLKVTHFTTINQPVKTSPRWRANLALHELNIKAYIENGNLVIHPTEEDELNEYKDEED